MRSGDSAVLITTPQKTSGSIVPRRVICVELCVGNIHSCMMKSLVVGARLNLEAVPLPFQFVPIEEESATFYQDARSSLTADSRLVNIFF